jgi:hypothetical protein
MPVAAQKGFFMLIRLIRRSSYCDAYLIFPACFAFPMVACSRHRCSTHSIVFLLSLIDLFIADTFICFLSYSLKNVDFWEINKNQMNNTNTVVPQLFSTASIRLLPDPETKGVLLSALAAYQEVYNQGVQLVRV